MRWLGGVLCVGVLCLAACTPTAPADSFTLTGPEYDVFVADGGTPPDVSFDARPRVVSADELSVGLAWDAWPAPAPSSVVVVRDGQPVATLPGTSSEFLDQTVAHGGLEAPAAQASTTLEDEVEVTWSEASATPAPSHTWELLAQWSGVTSRSSPVSGAAATPVVERYEVSEDDGGTWLDAGVERRFVSWREVDASVDLSGLSTEAHADDRRTIVQVALDGGIGFTFEPQGFLVRAQSRVGPGAVASVAGQQAGELPVSVQWQRSAGDSDSAYSDLPFVSGWRWFDAHPVLDEGRWYRPVLTLDDGRSWTLPGMRALQWGAKDVAIARDWNGVLRNDGRVVTWGEELGRHTYLWAGTWDRIVGGGDINSFTEERICAQQDGGPWTCSDGRSFPPAGYPALAQLDIGSATCGVADGGGLFCWTTSADGGLTELSVPDAGFERISVGNLHGCGITKEGTLRCWPLVGPTPFHDVEAEARVHDGEPVRLVATRGYASLALQDDGGTLFWTVAPVGGPYFSVSPLVGDERWIGTDGQFYGLTLNHGGLVRQVAVYSQVPDAVMPVSTAIDKFALGRAHYCGISQQQVFCDGMRIGWRPPFNTVTTPLADPVVDVAGTTGRVVAILTDGGISTWGNYFHGYPVLENDSLGVPWVQVASGIASNSLCGLRANGQVGCVSGMWSGPLLPAGPTKLVGGHMVCGIYPGVGIRCDTTSPPVLVGDFVDAKVANGTCGLTPSGNVVCTDPTLSRTGDFDALAMGWLRHTFAEVCAHSASHGWDCWPTALDVSPLATQVEIGDGYCELRRGLVKCFTESGQPVFGNLDDYSQAVVPLRTRYAKITVYVGDQGYLAGCGIRSDGVVECFGARNVDSQGLPRP